jgi:hypothetical protein
VLTSSYLKDALELHSDSGSSNRGVDKSNLYTEGTIKFNLNKRRTYSTKPRKSSVEGRGDGSIYYANADAEKLKILADNKDKVGIYMLTNKINGKRYIGSSVNLRRRVLEYFNLGRLLRDPSMLINTSLLREVRGLLKYGYYNFSFEVLEYCAVKDLMKQEKFYLDQLKPEYNILKEPPHLREVVAENIRSKLRLK